MAGFEDVYPLEGMRKPWHARRELRQIFGRWLPRPIQMQTIGRSGDEVDELSILDLCQHYRLEYPGGAEDLAKSWDESAQRAADNGLSFNELKSKGWVLFDGSRWTMPNVPVGIRSVIAYPSPSTEAFLTGLNKIRLVAKTDSPPSHAKALADRIWAEQWLERRIPTKNPDWLAGRLWERLCPKPNHQIAGDSEEIAETLALADNEIDGVSVLLEAEAAAVDRAFLEWSAWCNALDSYDRWDASWSSTEMRYCREAAHRTLDRQRLWGKWETDTAQYAATLESTFAIPLDQLRYGGGQEMSPPKTLISRADWLRRPSVEHLIMERLGPSTTGFALNLLCSELEKTDTGSEILAEGKTILSFVADHPIAFQLFLFRVDSVPKLLVDMLLHQRMTCLAIRILIEWRSGHMRHDDRNLTRDAQTKTYAIQDALSVLAHYLAERIFDLSEYASLVTWCYGSEPDSRRGFSDSRRPIGRTLLELIAKEDAELQSGLLKHLVDQAAYTDNVYRACFAATLDGLSCLLSASANAAFPIVTLYSKFVREQHLEWTDASALSADMAAQLVVNAFAQDTSERDALLIPFDSVSLLHNARGDEKSLLRYSVAKTLRQHVILLARAVAGWPNEEVPLELSKSLQKLTALNVIEHEEKGRIGALTDRYGSSFIAQREKTPPAKDLADAWRRLDGTYQEFMLQAFVASDDPVLLAELCQYLPAEAKPSIRTRLRQLKPLEASTYWTWTELQHRIESLLAAGEYALAREHLDDIEQEIDRAPPQFRIGLFDLELQLYLKEMNWAALDEVAVPLTLDQRTKALAETKLEFYRATSQLVRPDGNLAGAQATFQRLARRSDAATAYQENAFAVAIKQLLGPTLHPLVGEAQAVGKSLLAEINAVVSSDESSASSSLLANRALLLIALQRSKDALDSIAARRREVRDPGLELVAVLAMCETGRKDDAMAMLDAAILEFDVSDQLIALKDDLQAGDAAPSFTAASTVQDPTLSVRIALQSLSEFLPSQVGDVLGPSGRGLQGYLLREVSRAVASLQHMAAILRARKGLMNDAKLENDLNTAFREVLTARLAVAKWDVADQSLGGITENGNPGERDAVIRSSGQEIAIFEALVCSSASKSYIKEHFHKLLSYGVCDLYFHVIYSYASTPSSILKYVEKMLEHEVPSGLIYLRREPLGLPDYEVDGYVATYRVDRREVAVAFMTVDLKNP